MKELGGVHIKKLGFYVFHILAFLFSVAYMDKTSNQLNLIAMKEVHLSSLHILVVCVYPIVVGILVALPEFINKLRSKGKVVINWTKLFVIVIPTLCLILWRVLYFVAPISFNVQFIHSPYIGVIFGYTLLTVIYKSKDSDKIR